MIKAGIQRKQAGFLRSVLRAGGARLEPLESRLLFSVGTPATAAELVGYANNAFGLDLLNELSKENSGKNVFISPYSVASALELALLGAKGTTAAELIRALHLPEQAVARAGISALYQLFQADSAKTETGRGLPLQEQAVLRVGNSTIPSPFPLDLGTTGYTLSTANRLWVDEHFELLDSFLNSSQEQFGALPGKVDFSDPVKSAATINDWVSKQTGGKIQNLISANAIDMYTTLILTNAVYFKGDWVKPFKENATYKESFFVSETMASTVSMMHQTDQFGYYEQPGVGGVGGFQALSMPYIGGNMEMLVILPTTYQLAEFQAGLTADTFSRIAANLDYTKVEVSLPKFKMNQSYELTSTLEKMGINMAFSRQADFSGISADGENLQVVKVLHQTFVSVNETGTEAAGATGGMMKSGFVIYDPAPPVVFNADHPFLFAIRDRVTNTMLFLGREQNPGGDLTSVAYTPMTAIDEFAGVETPISALPVNQGVGETVHKLPTLICGMVGVGGGELNWSKPQAGRSTMLGAVGVPEMRSVHFSMRDGEQTFSAEVLPENQLRKKNLGRPISLQILPGAGLR